MFCFWYSFMRDNLISEVYLYIYFRHLRLLMLHVAYEIYTSFQLYLIICKLFHFILKCIYNHFDFNSLLWVYMIGGKYSVVTEGHLAYRDCESCSKAPDPEALLGCSCKHRYRNILLLIWGFHWELYLSVQANTYSTLVTSKAIEAGSSK